MRKLARNVAIILLTLSVLWLLWEFRGALVLFLLSLWFTATVRPLVQRLINNGLPRVIAIMMIYFVGLATAAGLFITISPSWLSELETLSDRFVNQYTAIWQSWPEGSPLEKAMIAWLPEPNELFSVVSLDTGNPFASGVLGFFTGSFAVIGQLFIALILSIYWTADRVRFERLWLSLLPAEARVRARTIYRDVEDGVGAYTRSELAQSLAVGFLLWIGFLLMGLPYPTLLAMVGAVAWLIPWVGIVVTLALAFTAGLSVSLLLGLLAAVFSLAVMVATRLVLEPMLFRREYRSSLLTILLIIALGGTLGLIGIVIAPPLAAAIQMAGRHMMLQPSAAALSQESLEKILQLEQHQQRLREYLEEMEEGPSPQIENILERLNHLVARAKEVLEVQPDMEDAGSREGTPPAPGRLGT